MFEPSLTTRPVIHNHHIASAHDQQHTQSRQVMNESQRRFDNGRPPTCFSALVSAFSSAMPTRSYRFCASRISVEPKHGPNHGSSAVPTVSMAYI